MARVWKTVDKKEALLALAERKKRGKTERKINNAELYAGSSMHFDCKVCGCQDIVVSESYRSKPSLCHECQKLKDLGWLGE